MGFARRLGTLFEAREQVGLEFRVEPLAGVRHGDNDVIGLAADILQKRGVSVEIIDPRTLQPLDEDALVASVKKTNRAVVAHEAVTRMGFGAEVASVIQYKAFAYLDAPIERVGAKFAPLAFAPVMEQFIIPHAEDVLAAIKRTVGK